MVYEPRSNFWQARNQSLHKVWETTMNTQQRCGRMSKIIENSLNTAVFGHVEHYNRSNVAPTESYKMSEHNIFLLQPCEHQQIRKPTTKTDCRRSGYSEVIHYCLFWMMRTTLSITQLYKSPIRANKKPYCQETPQSIGVPSHTTMEIYVYMFLSQWHTILPGYPSWNYGRSLVLSNLTNIPRLMALCSDASAVSV